MKSLEVLQKEQDRLLLVYEKVKRLLEGYPNVIKVGIGIKEKDGKLSDEGCIKIIVKEKKDALELRADEIIPKEVEGVKTDIVVYGDKIPLTACAEDINSYRPIKGGICINNVRNGGSDGGSGTLGCMAQLNSDNSWVILSNHHVLYGDSGEDGDYIGQPWVGCSWCCKTNIIAKNLNKNLALDCAIAKMEADISITNIIEEIINIGGAGAVAAVNGQRVRKRGARTGITSGQITFIDPADKQITITPNAAGGPSNDPGGCTNYVAGKTIFAYFGDSGSVVVNDNNEVVALLFSIDGATNTLGFANDIMQIQTTLGIKIKTTSAAAGRTIIYREPENVNSEKIVIEKEWTSAVQHELNKTHIGRTILNIFKVHEVELFNLINKYRPVTLTWQRKQGPAFLAAFSRSIKYTDYKIPVEINRVTLQNLLMSMASILEEHGSEAMRTDVQKYSLQVIQFSNQCHTAADFFKLLEITEKNSLLLSFTNY